MENVISLSSTSTGRREVGRVLASLQTTNEDMVDLANELEDDPLVPHEEIRNFLDE